jgi:hypothetical protein
MPQSSPSATFSPSDPAEKIRLGSCARLTRYGPSARRSRRRIAVGATRWLQNCGGNPAPRQKHLLDGRSGNQTRHLSGARRHRGQKCWSQKPPPAANNEGWLPLGNTSFCAYPLLPMASSARVEAQTPSGSANSSASSRIDILSPPRPTEAGLQTVLCPRVAGLKF